MLQTRWRNEITNTWSVFFHVFCCCVDVEGGNGSSGLSQSMTSLMRMFSLSLLLLLLR